MRLAPALVLVCLVTAAHAQEAAYEGGLSVATGRYIFTERTTSWALLSGLAVTLGRVSLRATVPVFAQNTTLITGSPTGRVPTGGSSSGAVADSGRDRQGGGRGSSGAMSEAGAVTVARGPPVSTPPSATTGYRVVVGDPTAQGTARLIQSGGTTVSTGITVKLPITDTTAFGTGNWDAGAMVSIMQIVSPIVLSADVAYWWFGDMPELELRDGPWGTLSVSGVLGAWALTASGSVGTATLAGFERPVSLSASVGRLAGGTLWSFTASVGLTETAPDLSLAASWRIGL